MQFDLVVYSFVVSRASFSLISSPPLEGKKGLHSYGGFVNERVSGRELDPPKRGAAAVELEFWKSVGALLPSLPSRR